jgi:hypothetical protein
LEDKFVIMYSGNHSPCHPLDTVLGAAKELSAHKDVAFCFVGGGAEFARVKRFVQEEKLANTVCLPYQPLDQLAGALSAADLQLVVMGDPFVGMVHPCKAYNILRVGSPLLYIGPEPSHITELLSQANGHLLWRRAAHGQVAQVMRHILDLKGMVSPTRGDPDASLTQPFSEETLLPLFVNVLESAVHGPGISVKPGSEAEAERGLAHSDKP